MPPKTRLNTSTQISVAFGTGKQFLVSELPTNKDVIRYGILFREDCDDIKKRNYPEKRWPKICYQLYYISDQVQIWNLHHLN